MAAALLPWSWFALRARGGLLEFAAVVWPIATAVATVLAVALALVLRRTGPLAVGLSVAVLGLIGLVAPWRPIAGGTIVEDGSLRVVSTNIAHQDAVELAAALHDQDADVVVLTELSVGIDEAMLRTYPYIARTDGALAPWEPDTLTVDRGARIRVGNTDGVTHTLTAQDGSFDTGDLRGGASRTITLDRPGHFTYRCRIHDYMTGEVTVR